MRGSGLVGSPLPPCACRPVSGGCASRSFHLTPRSVDRGSVERFSLAVQPSSGPAPVRLPPSFRGGASLGVLVPFSAMGSAGYIPRSSILGYRPRPRFLTVLAGILPADPFRACFVPEALLGFSLQGVPLGRSTVGSSPSAPLMSFPRWPPFHLRECLGLLTRAAESTSGVFTSSESVRDDGSR